MDQTLRHIVKLDVLGDSWIKAKTNFFKIKENIQKKKQNFKIFEPSLVHQTLSTLISHLVNSEFVRDGKVFLREFRIHFRGLETNCCETIVDDFGDHPVVFYDDYRTSIRSFKRHIRRFFPKLRVVHLAVIGIFGRRTHLF
ncbi:hypothetical protein [Brazilian marseillevirus]|uniref:hypothetical protein n=1 Tax=Brazilian marseillevirus TaxID=1813599 RepID=UPI00078181B4|nr:hypothetical protein A3303_gp300 [Brazilian marseillevirus]AMQ10808.1 hypothetical protein [Brazilian marseillevirus]